MRFSLIAVFGSGPWTAKVKDTAVISARPSNLAPFEGRVRAKDVRTVRYGIEMRIFEAKIIFSINSINNFNDRLW